MASLTLTTDATNTAKIQTVVDYYNLVNGTSYTIKQWIIAIVRQAYIENNTARLTSLVVSSDSVTVT